MQIITTNREAGELIEGAAYELLADQPSKRKLIGQEFWDGRFISKRNVDVSADFYAMIRPFIDSQAAQCRELGDTVSIVETDDALTVDTTIA